MWQNVHLPQPSEFIPTGDVKGPVSKPASGVRVEDSAKDFNVPNKFILRHSGTGGQIQSE